MVKSLQNHELLQGHSARFVQDSHNKVLALSCKIGLPGYQTIPTAYLLGHDLSGVCLGLQQRKHLLHNCLTVFALLVSELVATGNSRS